MNEWKGPGFNKPIIIAMSLADFLTIVSHALECRIPGCRVKKCHKTKRLLDHNRQCKRDPCTKCASLIKVHKYHATQCPKDSGCEHKFCKIRIRVLKQWNSSLRMFTQTKLLCFQETMDGDITCSQRDAAVASCLLIKQWASRSIYF